MAEEKDLATDILKELDRAEDAIKRLGKVENFDQCRAGILDTMRKRIKALTEDDPIEYFEDFDEATASRYEPVMPCRLMRTRTCVDISMEDHLYYRKAECKPGECTRFEYKDKKE